jgi:hypothetical protein
LRSSWQVLSSTVDVPPVVTAYQAMRGVVSFLVAVTFAAEIGNVRRFDTPRQLMSFARIGACRALDR